MTHNNITDAISAGSSLSTRPWAGRAEMSLSAWVQEARKTPLLICSLWPER